MNHLISLRETLRALAHRARRRCIVGCAATLVSLSLSHECSAAPITVTFAGDRPLTLAPGESPRSDCSLREALNNADNKSSLPSNACASGTGDDVVEFAVGLSGVKLDTKQFGVLSIKSNTLVLVRGHNYYSRVFIDGQNLGGIIDIDNTDALVRFENIHFFAGNRAGAGGAILHKGGRLILSGCRFDVNTAKNGGALAVTGSDAAVFIDDCVFHENTAEGVSGDVTQGFGGAIWFAGRTAGIHRVVFNNNVAKLRGGAIECQSGGSMEISGGPAAIDTIGEHNSFFLGNSTLLPNADLNGAGGGGAISSECGLTVVNTRFQGNQTAGKGGAVYVRSNSVSAYFHQVAFDQNHAQSDGAFAYGGAGAVEGKVVFNRTSAYLNTASYGGAFLVRGINGVAYASFENSSLLLNKALEHDGAGFYFVGPLQENRVSILNSTLDENDGGAGGSTLFFGNNIAGSVVLDNSILQAKNGTRNCGGSVSQATFNTIQGSRSLQFDVGAGDSCDVGVPSLAIPKNDAGFAVRGVAVPTFPHMRYNSIDTYSPAVQLPGVGVSGCQLVGFDRPPTWVALPYGRDQIGKLRDGSHCSRGAVEPVPHVVVDP